MDDLKEGRFFPLVREAVRDRRLIWQLAKNDFKTKFAGSYLGIIWAFIQPVVTVLVYWFVFEVGLRASAKGDVPYVLHLMCGLVPWFFFSDGWNGGTSSLMEYSYLVKKVVFKISIIPIVKVISALFVHIFFVCFMLFIFICTGNWPGIYAVQVIYYSFCTFMLILGLSYMTSAVVVFFRDLTQIVGIILQIGVWMTPIMWEITIIPEPLRWIFKLNPLYYIVSGYRDSLIEKIWIWEKMSLTIYFWVFTLVVFGIGTFLFKRLKVHFADVL